jgi:hypothetical protein
MSSAWRAVSDPCSSEAEARGYVGFSGVDQGLRGRHVRRFPGQDGRRLDLPTPAVAALLRRVRKSSCDQRGPAWVFFGVRGHGGGQARRAEQPLVRRRAR